MRERPILFSAAMVRAILDGRKSQTRRAIKPQQPRATQPLDLPYEFELTERNGDVTLYTLEQLVEAKCPYGKPGDRLFVKEAWRTALDLDNLSPSAIGEKCTAASYPCPWAPLKYEADHAEVNRFAPRDMGDAWGRTRVSIHMPRWASRITLEITDVRVERLQAITEEDARAEGVDWAAPQPYGERWDDDDREDPREVGYPPAGASFALDNFRRLWNSINGKPRPMLDDDGEPVLDDNERPIMISPRSWDSNPFVWVISFRRVEAQELK